MKAGYQSKGYRRNNPESADVAVVRAKMAIEIGQAYMMLLTYATSVGVDLQSAFFSALWKQTEKIHGELEENEQEEDHVDHRRHIDL